MKDDPKYNVFASKCPSRDLFDHVFSRWGILILARLDDNPLRFRELSRAVEGISERMLSKTLKALEQEELVNRKEYDEKPPRVEYSLTNSGTRISESIQGVIGQLYKEMEDRIHGTQVD